MVPMHAGCERQKISFPEELKCSMAKFTVKKLQKNNMQFAYLTLVRSPSVLMVGVKLLLLWKWLQNIFNRSWKCLSKSQNKCAV